MQKRNKNNPHEGCDFEKIDEAVERVVDEYGDTLKMLADEPINNWEEIFNQTGLARAGGSCWEVCDFEAIVADTKQFISELLKQKEQETRAKVIEEIRLEKKEVQLLIALVEGEKASVNLLRGFRKPSREEQDENAYFNALIEKIKKFMIEIK